ncbi:MAG: hypothetical protein Q4C01_05425 [Clostridia bacterium]|nr:hypothetical protein [Clostridia bacterium]
MQAAKKGGAALGCYADCVHGRDYRTHISKKRDCDYESGAALR